jgi:hypothetical protein
MSQLSFAEYLEQRRSNYTQEWQALQELKSDAAFREARSWPAIETYLNARDAPLGVRQCARAAWVHYQQAKRRARA